MPTKATKKSKHPVAQNPLILRCHRLMEAFAKSDDERDFYLDRVEGFIIYVNLDKETDDLIALEKEIVSDPDRYCAIPKLTFYEAKKIMEGFVNEKVYDIDTKEKLLDIIGSKEAREHFLEFIFDHHTELDKWQQYYQERSRIRIIEWLRKHEFYFVFEEDVDINKHTMEHVKESLFKKDAGRDVIAARKVLTSKAKTYYSNEALNPRPKRGRPPKQTAKLEVEPQVSVDIYTTVIASVRPFLFVPDISHASAASFSSKFDSEEELIASRRLHTDVDHDLSMENLNKKLASLRDLSSRLMERGLSDPMQELDDFEPVLEIEETETPATKPKKAAAAKKPATKAAPAKKAAAPKKAAAKPKATTKKAAAPKKAAATKKAAAPKKATAKKPAASKKASTTKAKKTK